MLYEVLTLLWFAVAAIEVFAGEEWKLSFAIALLNAILAKMQ